MAVPQIEGFIGTGRAIDITGLAGKHFRGSRVAIDAAVYARHVEWSSQAMRQHSRYLEEPTRLHGLIASAMEIGAGESNAVFSHSSVDAAGQSPEPVRHHFQLLKFEEFGRTEWLITQ